MAINFDNTEVLSISQTNLKFDSDLTFKKEKVLEVSGYLIDLQNTSGVKNIFEETSDIVEVFENSTNGTITRNIQDISVNGVSYGSGMVEDFSVNGDQIQTAIYNAVITINESAEINDIILSDNNPATTPTSTSGGLSLGDSSLVSNDLKYLKSFEESFSFSYSGSEEVSVNHNISCVFSSRESLISNKKDIWTNATIQASKLKKLKNKGKGSIKVNAGNTASYVINLDPGSYVLYFDYLGQDALNYGSASVDFGGESKNLETTVGRKKIEITLSSLSSITISLNANNSNNTFFDNLQLFKKDEMPLQKSRALANFLFENSPNYGIIGNSNQEKYKAESLFDNFSKTETFDEISSSYSAQKTIAHSKLQASDEYSFLGSASFVYEADGSISVTETGTVKILKNKNDTNLKNHVNTTLSGSYNRCLDLFNSLENIVEYGCPPTNTETQTKTAIQSLYSNPVVESVNYNFFDGSASISVQYSNDESYKETSKKYKHEGTEEIRELDGFYQIAISGLINGDGDDTDEKNIAAKQGLTDIISDATSRVNEAKVEFSSSSFYLTSKNIQTDKFAGAISYSFIYSDTESLSQETGGVVKNYEIDVDVTEPTSIINSFTINCLPIGQKLKNIFNYKTISTKIRVVGFSGVSQITLLTAAKSILTAKSLLLGEDSENQDSSTVESSSENEFLTNQSYSYSSRDNSLVYGRDVIDLSTCPVETATSTNDENFGWDELFYSTPEPDPTYTSYTFFAPTFTFTEQPPLTPTFDVPFDFYTPTKTQTTSPQPTTTITETITETETETPEPTLTLTPSETITQTETITDTTITFYELEVYIPDGWGQHAADLLPDGNIKFGKECLNVGGSLDDPAVIFINQSWADNTSNTVKDCYKGQDETAVRAFHSIVFDYPNHLPTPTPPGDSYCNFFEINLPNFFSGTIEELYQFVGAAGTVTFIGGYRPTGLFEYNNGISTTKNLARSSIYNSSHPNFENNVEVYLGPLIFESCAQIESLSDQVFTVSIPNNNTDSLRDVIDNALNWQAGDCLEIVGYRDCFGVNRFNEIVSTPTTTMTSTRLVNYMAEESLSACGELSSNRTIQSAYVKKTSCSSTTKEEGIY